ncbi:DUF2577 family protein [Andreesenia angusta]|nr:DUF2577 family protein [Andreesenia angusta]
MWGVRMAKHFKERDNEARIGNVIGTVVASSPLKISILNGDVILDKRHLYITHGASIKEYGTTLTAGTNIGTVSTPAGAGQLVNINIIDSESAKLTTFLSLAPGDEVLLCPAEREQVFFIIDKVKRVGE